MSMWLSIARVDADTFAKIQKDGSIVDAIFFGDGVEGVETAGVDYRIALEGLEAMSEATGEDLGEGDAVLNDLGVSGELDFDAGYGPAFYVEPAAAKKEATRSLVCELDDEAKSIIAGAAKAGDYLIGVIS